MKTGEEERDACDKHVEGEQLWGDEQWRENSCGEMEVDRGAGKGDRIVLGDGQEQSSRLFNMLRNRAFTRPLLEDISRTPT